MDFFDNRGDLRGLLAGLWRELRSGLRRVDRRAIFENNRPSILMQASWNLDDFETRKREERALLGLGKKLDCGKLLIVTKEKTPSDNPEIEILGIKEFFDFLK